MSFLAGNGLESRAGWAAEFDPFGTAVEVQRHADFMRTACGRREVRHGHIVAVAKLDDIGLYSQRNDKRVAILGTEDTAVPNATYDWAFADITTKVELLEFALPAVEDVGGDECTGIARIAIERKQSPKVGGELHGQAADAHYKAFVGLIQVVSCETEVYFFAESNNAGAEVNLTDFSASWLRRKSQSG